MWNKETGRYDNSSKASNVWEAEPTIFILFYSRNSTAHEAQFDTDVNEWRVYEYEGEVTEQIYGKVV